VMNADGSGQTQLLGGEAVGGSVWSPDGAKIAFSRCSFGIECDIWTMNTDGTGQTQITTGFYDEPRSWSPDGSEIAFSRCVPSGFSHGSISFSQCHIATVRPDGSGVTGLTHGSGFDYSPDWSPDGTKIAFNRWANGTSSTIYTMNADGSGETAITDPAVGFATGPAWSPDGTKIAFTLTTTGHVQIYVMNTDGSAQTNLSNSTTDDTAADWQPIPGPQRSDYKNAAQFCKAERDFRGDDAFRQKYGGGSNAYGKCVSGR
jgi:Tol biopolymer transport system component